MKAIVIGRHKLTGDEGIEPIDQRGITFPAHSKECQPILAALLKECRDNDYALIFQAMPGQVIAALWWMLRDAHGYHRIGIIVSMPGDRPAGAKKTFTDFDGAIEEAVRFVNPRAEIIRDKSHLEIAVDPPMRFVFSHIEWL